MRELSHVPSTGDRWDARGLLAPAPRRGDRGCRHPPADRHLRAHGALPGAFGHGDPSVVAAAARTAPALTTPIWSAGFRRARSIRAERCAPRGGSGLRHQDDDGAPTREAIRLSVVPAATSAEEIRSLNPDGVFLSNGPGDPAALGEQVRCSSSCWALSDFRHLSRSSLLAQALGGCTFKLPSDTTAATTRSVT